METDVYRGWREGEMLPSCHSFSDININSNERSDAPEQETGGLPCFHFPGAPALFSAPAPFPWPTWSTGGLDSGAVPAAAARSFRASQLLRSTWRKVSPF